MPNFSSAVLPGEKLDKETLMFAIQQSMADEHEAAMRYIQIANATENEAVKKIMLDVAKEEHIHAGEFRKLMALIYPDESAHEEQGFEEAAKKLSATNTEEAKEETKTVETGKEAEETKTVETYKEFDKENKQEQKPVSDSSEQNKSKRKLRIAKNETN